MLRTQFHNRWLAIRKLAIETLETRAFLTGMVSVAPSESLWALEDFPEASPAEWDSRIHPSMAQDINPDADVFETILVADETEIDLGTGQMTEMWTYNGVSPGPSIDIEVGNTLIVHFYNRLAEPTTVHWHGVEAPANMDGSNLAQLAVAPGGYFRYEFQIHQTAQFWYHPHINTGVQVERGLYGSLTVRDPEEHPLLGVQPNREHVLMLDDILLDDDGQVADAHPADPLENAERHVNGREGNVLLVNGQVNPEATIERNVPHRFRLVNASNTRFMRVSIPGHTMWRVGGDGGLLETPIEIEPIGMMHGDGHEGHESGMMSDPDPNKGILLTPGERADVVFIPTGEGPLELQWHDIARGRHSAFYAPDGSIAFGHAHDDGQRPHQTLMTINLSGEAQLQEYQPPEDLRTIEPIDTSDAEKIVLTFGHGMPDDAGNVMFFAQMVDGVPVPFSMVTSELAPVVHVGDTRIWEVHNLTGGDHNFHPHGFSFQPIEIEFIDLDNPENNRVIPFEMLEEKDTILVPSRPGAKGRSRTIFRGAVTFDDTNREGRVAAAGKEPTEIYSGGWVVHCHILEHAGAGMLTFVQVIDDNAPTNEDVDEVLERRNRDSLASLARQRVRLVRPILQAAHRRSQSRRSDAVDAVLGDGLVSGDHWLDATDLDGI